MNQVPNSLKQMLWKGQISVLTDTFKIILMQVGFTFNKDSHHSYSDISVWELPTGNGYTVRGQSLSGVAIVTDNVEDRAEVTFTNVQWTALGGALNTVGAIIFNDSTATGSGDDYTDAIITFLDAEGIRNIPDGSVMTVSGIMLTAEDI